jgi:hypothetical protein
LRMDVDVDGETPVIRRTADSGREEEVLRT